MTVGTLSQASAGTTVCTYQPLVGVLVELGSVRLPVRRMVPVVFLLRRDEDVVGRTWM
jgi:hypothetical protein